MSDMPIRIMGFDLPAKFDPVVNRKLPELGFVGLALSLTMPYLEPYLIRTMLQAAPKAKDPRIKATMKAFCGQEGQHFRQHAKLNDLLKAQHPGFQAVTELEDALEADYQRFTKEKSLKFNLAYAEGFEAMTMALARWGFKSGHLFDMENKELKRLFEWHLTEELEHRTVTFEAYEHLFGDYLYRCAVGFWAQCHFIGYVLRMQSVLQKADKDYVARTGGRWARVKRLASVPFRWSGYLAMWSRTYLPTYNPGKCKMPDHLEEMSAGYTDQALNKERLLGAA
jgi:hypothetical protein